jgi:hypothetical protein
LAVCSQLSAQAIGWGSEWSSSRQLSATPAIIVESSESRIIAFWVVCRISPASISRRRWRSFIKAPPSSSE